MLEALDWLIKHNALYQDLQDTDWRNKAAIEDYTTEATFTIKQHMSKNPKRAPPKWRDDNKAEEWAGGVELGRTQPGLDDNAQNIPARTPSHDVGEGDYVMYDEEVHAGLERCRFNPDGPECLNPKTCTIHISCE